MVLALWTNAAFASFHIMRISEALGGWAGDSSIQCVELTMAAGGQNFVNGHKLLFFDAAGVKTGEVLLNKNMASGANGSSILIATSAFEAAFKVTPDFILPEGLMAPTSGRVCFDAIDCVAYGEFTGNNGTYGDPAPGFPPDGRVSLTIKAVTPPSAASKNSNDYELRDPTPRNNAGQLGTVPEPGCFLEDPLTDLSRWDVPTAGAGIDLGSCGQPGVVDVGTVDAAAGVLSLSPGSFDFPGIGPLGLTGLKSSVASTFPTQDYRLTFDVEADQGIVVGAVFVRQHYDFDEAAGVLDVGSAFGFGINFSFDDLNNEASDHLHADLRTNCFQDPDIDGEDEGSFPGFKMTSGATYSVVLDVDGDDEVGPLTLQAKLYPAGEAEPAGYLGTYLVADVASRLGGIDHSDSSLDHGVLLAAIGASNAALNFSNFKFCPLPLSARGVRSLTCARQEDGTILVTWTNPAGGAETPIEVRVNGGSAQTVPASATSIELAGEDGPLTISVKNFSGTSVDCSICENNPPAISVTAPGVVELVDGTATFALDSTATTDGDNSQQTLTRQWEIVSAPAGGSATLDDPTGVLIQVNVNAEGSYVLRLTVSDNGCQGDPGQTAQKDVTVRVGPLPAGGAQKPGDENQDGNLDLSDAVSVLNHLFLGTNPSLPCGDGTTGDAGNIKLLDANGDGRIDLSDAVNLLAFLFLGGPQPAACTNPDCPCLVIEGCPDACAQ